MKLVYEPMKDLCFVLGLDKRKLKHVKFIKMDGQVFLTLSGKAKQMFTAKFKNAKDYRHSFSDLVIYMMVGCLKLIERYVVESEDVFKKICSGN